MSVASRGILASNLLLAASRAIVLLGIARLAGAEVQGAFSFTVAIIAFWASVWGSPLEYANAHLAGRTPGNVPTLVRGSIFGIAGCLAAGSALEPFVARLYPTVAAVVDRAGLIPVLAAGSFGALLAFRGLATGRREFARVARANAVWAGAWLVLGLMAVRWRVTGLLVAWLLATLLPLVVLARPRFQAGPAEPASGDLARAQARYAAVSVPGVIARAGQMRLAMYLGPISLGLDELGVLGIALAISDGLLLMPNAIATVVLGRSASGERDLSSERPILVVFVALVVVGAAAAFLLPSDVYVAVFGPDYGPLRSVLPFTLLGAGVHALVLVGLHAEIGRGRFRLFLLAQVSCLLSGLVAFLALLPRYGLAGAAVAYLLMYVGFAVGLGAGRRLMNRPREAED